VILFPVTAAVRSNANNKLKPANSVGIFDSYGYTVSFGRGPIDLPGDSLDLGLKIASMINAAYEYGKADAQAKLREALGIEEDQA